MNRNRTVTLRLTEAEYARIEAKQKESTAKNLSAYLRQAALAQDVSAWAEEKWREELVRQIRRIGVNVNQIAARNNSGLYFSTDKWNLYAHLQKLEGLLEDFHKNGEKEKPMERKEQEKQQPKPPVHTVTVRELRRMIENLPDGQILEIHTTFQKEPPL